MPTRPTTLFEELVSAARGVAAIVVGDRRAPGFFDFTLRGLAGSFIALLVAEAVNAFLPNTGGDLAPASSTAPAIEITPTLTLLLTVLVFAVQTGVAVLVLRRLKRQDGFVPYLVADNWSTFFLSAASIALRLVGVSDNVNFVFFGILLLVVEINSARLVVTLKPRQIVALLGLQLIALLITLVILASIFLPPDAGAAAAAGASL